MQAFGPQLRLIIEKSTQRRWKAFGAGIVVTSFIQSSTATLLIVTSFAARSLIPVAPALALSLGADVGTTLVAQVFSLGANGLGPILVLVGMIASGTSRVGRVKHIGMSFVGLGLILLGLGTIIHAAAVIQQSELMILLMETLGSDIMMAFLVGAMVTWLAQSSLAVVLLVMSFASAGAMTLDTAYALVLGTHVGSGIMPLLINLKQKNEASHIAWGSFLMRLVSCIVMLPLIHTFVHEVTWLGETTERRIVNFHTVFSFARAIVFLPFVGVIASLLKKIMPLGRDTSDPSCALYLDERDLSAPSIALASATRESLRMGDQVLSMLHEVKELFVNNHSGKLQQLLDRDNTVDRLYDQIKFYLAKLSREAMDEKQARRHVDLLMFITNLEHVGDIIVHNLCELSAKKWRNNLTFSKQGWAEIEAYHKRICDNFNLAMNVFTSGDPVLARQLVRQKEAVAMETVTATGSHFERLRQGLLESIRSSSLHLDILRDLRGINNSVTSIAYSILEANGALQSRLRDESTN
jgi:phosphate:Na+ symporter